MGVGGDDAGSLLEVLVAVTGSNTGSSSAVGGPCPQSWWVESVAKTQDRWRANGPAKNLAAGFFEIRIWDFRQHAGPFSVAAE